MSTVASFEKVSFEQFKNDVKKQLPFLNEAEISDAYKELSLPKRGSTAAAGYDFVAPYDCVLEAGAHLLFPSGTRAKIENDYFLMIVPRSSLGLKYQLMLMNTTGIIDADYYYADNEGHIMFPLINRGDKDLVIKRGDRLVQGIFLKYYLAQEEEVLTKRSGGFGSTGK